MGHKILSEMELYLSIHFSRVFPGVEEVVDSQNATAHNVFERYVSRLTEKDLQAVCLNIQALLCNPYSPVRGFASQPDSGARFGTDANYEFFKEMCNKTLPEISELAALREIFGLLYELYQQRILRQTEEERALSLQPAEVREFWSDQDFYEKVCFNSDGTGEPKLVSDYPWGRIELRLVDAKQIPPVETESSRALGYRELYCTHEGYGLSVRYCPVNEDGLETMDKTEQEILFREVDYSYQLFDYYNYTMTNGRPGPCTNLIQARRLASMLVEKHGALGDAALSQTERWLFPAAQVVVHLCGHYSFDSVQRFMQAIVATPEDLDHWAEILLTDAKDKNLSRAFSTIAQRKRSMNKASIWKVLNAMKYANIVLALPEGRPVLHWILNMFRTACSEYTPKPSISAFHETAANEFRKFVTMRLSKDGFSGDYPHFRRVSASSRAELISFAEVAYTDRGMAALLTTGVINLGKDNSVQGVSYEHLTAYDCQHTGGRCKARYAIICGVENPAYRVSSGNPYDEDSDSTETARAEFELHLEQAYRVLAGQRMTKEYKARYGIKSNLGQGAWKLGKLCCILGVAWGTLFWLLFSVFISIDTKSPYMNVLMDTEAIVIVLGSGLLFGLLMWVVGFLAFIQHGERK